MSSAPPAGKRGGSGTKTCLIAVPQDNDKTAAAFEQVLIQLHETLRSEQLSLELVSTGQNISFCYTASNSVADVVSGQIYAMASDAYIHEVGDFTQNLDEKTRTVSAEVSLVRTDLFPLRDYGEFEGESLSGVLSVLSKCIPGEMVIVQIVIRPRRDSGLHHLKSRLKRSRDRPRHLFRLKYWFKKGASQSFSQKIQEKFSRRLFETNIRISCLSWTGNVDPAIRMQSVIGAYSGFNTLDYNQLRFRTSNSQSFLHKVFRRYLGRPFLLSTKELATLYHLPSEREVPNIVHVLSKKQAPPTSLPTNQKDPNTSFIGETNFRGQHIPFGIKYTDRRRHLYVCGKSGSGKSKLLELLIRNDILSGRGVGILDPHGDLVDNALEFVPKSRIKDVILFDPADLAYPPSFNPLEQVPEELKIRVTIGFIEIFKKLFGTNWSPRLEHVLRYTTLALLDSPGTTVLSILKMLSDKNYRQKIVRGIQDNVVKNFWVNEFAGWSEKFDSEAITPLLNKVGQFVATNMIRNIVGQPTNRFNFREMMDSKKLLFMKVSKGILGEENASLLGSIAVTKMYQAAMSRADTPENKRTDYYFYVDEFQNFATDTFGEILSEARKYRLNLTIAHQFLGQLSEGMRKTVFGNVGSMITFRVGGEDADILRGEYAPRFSERDLINLGIREFCIKMSIEGEIQDAFSGRTLSIHQPKEHFVRECIDFSRATYARPLAEVKEILQQWEEDATQKPVKKEVAPAQAPVQQQPLKVSPPVAGVQQVNQPAPQIAPKEPEPAVDDDGDFEEPLI